MSPQKILFAMAGSVLQGWTLAPSVPVGAAEMPLAHHRLGTRKHGQEQGKYKPPFMVSVYQPDLPFPVWCTWTLTPTEKH